MPEPAERPLDIQRLFEALARHGVSYLVIGGVAVQVHGHRRTTKDLDVMPAPGEGNAACLAAALADLEAQPVESGSSPPTAEQLAVAAVIPSLLTIHGELHVLPEPKGAAGWDEMRSRALVIDLEGVEVAIAGLDDLIRMKLAAGRRADLDDAAALTALEESS